MTIYAPSNEVIGKIRFVTVAGLILNIFLVFAKGIGGLVFGSQALLADAFHSLSDLVSDFAVLLGVKYWSAPPDHDHPYGHGRIETLISAFIGFALGGAAIGLGWEALMVLRKGEIQVPEGTAFFIALFSIFSKEFLYHWTKRIAKETKSRALEANAWHHRSDAFSSIPVAAALAIAYFFPQFAFVDSLGAIVVAFFILYAAWKIVAPTLLELSDAGVEQPVRDEIIRIAMGVSEIKTVHKVRARQVGGYLIADMHAMIDPDTSAHDGYLICHKIRYRLAQSELNVKDTVIHLEPYYESRVIDISQERNEIVEELLAVWEDSARSSHAFLPDSEITALKPYVLDALRNVPQLYAVLIPGERFPSGFMGIDGEKLEMLFLRNACRGCGCGRKLLLFALDEQGVTRVDVNEQNPQACGFYEHFGFKTYGRSETDARGNSYPILHMKYESCEHSERTASS